MKRDLLSAFVAGILSTHDPTAKTPANLHKPELDKAQLAERQFRQRGRHFHPTSLIKYQSIIRRSSNGLKKVFSMMLALPMHLKGKLKFLKL
jgi:hypothetical protein